jgi:hypothetical protein
MGKKNRPGPPGYDKRIFLSPMRRIAGKGSVPASAAIPLSPLQAVYMTVPRAKGAGLQKVKGLGNSRAQVPVFIKIYICGPKNFAPLVPLSIPAMKAALSAPTVGVVPYSPAGFRRPPSPSGST